ncbi:hypothetical protein E2I00_007782, partial [Balaenoptera physalus]
FQDLKLKEFYCEGNPLFLKQPVNAVKHEDIWSLQEITSRLIMNQLAEKNPFLMQAIEWYPQVRNIISQGRKCAICGKSFLTVNGVFCVNMSIRPPLILCPYLSRPVLTSFVSKN